MLRPLYSTQRGLESKRRGLEQPAEATDHPSALQMRSVCVCVSDSLCPSVCVRLTEQNGLPVVSLPDPHQNLWIEPEDFLRPRLIVAIARECAPGVHMAPLLLSIATARGAAAIVRTSVISSLLPLRAALSAMSLGRVWRAVFLLVPWVIPVPLGLPGIQSKGRRGELQRGPRKSSQSGDYVGDAVAFLESLDHELVLSIVIGWVMPLALFVLARLIATFASHVLHRLAAPSAAGVQVLGSTPAALAAEAKTAAAKRLHADRSNRAASQDAVHAYTSPAKPQAASRPALSLGRTGTSPATSRAAAGKRRRNTRVDEVESAVEAAAAAAVEAAATASAAAALAAASPSVLISADKDAPSPPRTATSSSASSLSSAAEDEESSMTPPCLIASPSLEPTAEEGGETTSVSARTADVRAAAAQAAEASLQAAAAAKQAVAVVAAMSPDVSAPSAYERARLAHDRAQRRMARASAERGATPLSKYSEGLVTLSTTGSSGAGSEDDEGLITPPAGLSPRQLASRGQLRPTRLVWEEPLARSMRNSIETPMKVTLPKAIAAAEAGLFTRTASGKHVTAVVAHPSKPMPPTPPASRPYAPGRRNYEPQWSEGLRAIRSPETKAAWKPF